MGLGLVMIFWEKRATLTSKTLGIVTWPKLHNWLLCETLGPDLPNRTLMCLGVSFLHRGENF